MADSTTTTSTTPSAAAKTFRVGVIIGSQRVLRAGPQIAAFAQQIIERHLAGRPAGTGPAIQLETVDVAALGLPLLDETAMPAMVTELPGGYEHEHTRAWSARVAALDAFVVVSPQYNWGIPAGLKNALDYLFHEWKGKPFLVITYGGHGGDKCAAALQLVLGGGLRMRALQQPVCLTFPSRDFLKEANAGKDLALDAASDDGPWSDRRADIVKAWEELEQLLVAEPA